METRLTQLSEHIYTLPPDSATDRPVLGAVVGRRAVLVVDAGNSPTHARLLLAGLVEVTSTPLQYIVLTHWHWDHVFGASAFPAPLFAHRETKRKVEALAKLEWNDAALDLRVADGTEIAFCRDMFKAEWPDRTQLSIRPPDVSFDSGIEFDLGGVTCQVLPVGGDHSADSSIVYVLEDGVAFLGDCLYENLHHHPPEYTISKLFPLLDTLLNLDARLYVPAHDVVPMPRLALETLAKQMQAIGRTVEALGGQREPVLQHLQVMTGKPLDEDSLALVAAFLAGLSHGQS